MVRIHPPQPNGKKEKGGEKIFPLFDVRKAEPDFFVAAFERRKKGKMSSKQGVGALVLAAGKGTRMHSRTPKVLQPILEEPLLYYPLRALQEAGIGKIAVVVGYEGEQVEAYLKEHWPSVDVVWQRKQKGTGHAVLSAAPWWESLEKLLIIPGDAPLLSSSTLLSLVESFGVEETGCFLSFFLEDPSGYGRVVEKERCVAIIEEKDADETVKKIHDVNSGVYLFKTKGLKEPLSCLSCDNAQGEYYLTDLVRLLSQTGGSVKVVRSERVEELLGVNTPAHLALVSGILRDRVLAAWMEKGVKCMDPGSTWVGPRVDLKDDVLIEPFVEIWGNSKIDSECRIGSFSVLRNVELARRVRIVGHVRAEDCVIAEGAEIGPFAYLRDQAIVGEGAFVGKFVEVKKSCIGPHAKVPHLSYIGDAQVGEATNIGAGTITCNYDGKRKNPTKIGKRCFIGSDTMLVAPVELGDDAATGAGSVITEDVPEGALAIARAHQRNILGWSAKRSSDKGGK